MKISKEKFVSTVMLLDYWSAVVTKKLKISQESHAGEQKAETRHFSQEKFVSEKSSNYLDSQAEHLTRETGTETR